VAQKRADRTDVNNRAMNIPADVREDDLDGPIDSPSSKESSEKVGSTLELDAPGRLFDWKRVLRGMGVGLSLLWFVFFYVVIPTSAPFRLPVPVKVRLTGITVLSVMILILCLRGRARIIIGSLTALFVAWTLPGFWGLPGFW
jgi:hypothetical protein